MAIVEIKLNFKIIMYKEMVGKVKREDVRGIDVM